VAELSASNSKSLAINFGLALLAVGLLIVVFSVFEPVTYNKNLEDIGFMLLGLSVQLLGLGLIIIGKK
jgi:ABC-type Fe3+ transport system permease subunit